MKASLSLAFSVSATAALLAGCGGSQASISMPGAMPQSRAIATHAERGGSWMLPEAKGENLAYVSASSGTVYAYSYPALKEVAKKAQELPDQLFGVTVSVAPSRRD